MTSDLESVLTEHREDPAYADTCICEVSIPDTNEVEGHYIAHLAAVIEAEVIRPRERAAWSRGKNDAANVHPSWWDILPNPYTGEVGRDART